MTLVLLLIIAAVALGAVGVVVKGLLYLLFIGVVVLIAVRGSSRSADQAKRQAPWPGNRTLGLDGAHGEWDRVSWPS